nr:hypothetical protein [Tanacetum cinerariifolium]
MIDQAIQRNSTHTQEDASQNSAGGPKRPMQPARVCSYTDFMKCQPLNFRGTEGFIGLSRWVKKIESVFHISGCAVENQVKFAACTMLDATLTWWNSHVRTLGHDDAYAMTWKTFKKRFTDKYFSKGEIKKLEIELWNLKVDKYISRLPDNIYRNVMSARPKTLDFAIELANDLMDQKRRTYAERQAENKRKLDNNNQDQKQLLKKLWVMLKVSPWKGVIHFGKQGKLNPRYIGPFKKCLSDESLVIPLDELRIDDKLHFVEEPVQIIDCEIKQLKRSRIPIIKIESSETQEYPSLIQTYFDIHTVDDVFAQDEARIQYLQSYHEVGGDSESGGGGNDEPGADENADKDEDADGDEES